MSTDDATRAFSVFTNPRETQSTVIIGAGIIGCATAYYLATSGNTKTDTIHLVEMSPELFQSASGKSAGFLAPDWFGPATAELGALSYELHRKLAERYDGQKEWGYSKSTGTSLSEDGRLDGPRGDDWLRTGGSRAEVAGVHKFAGEDDGPAWLARRKGDVLEAISEDGGVAQIDPLRLCRFLIRQCILKGVRLHQPAKPVKVSRDESNEISAVRIRYFGKSEHKIPCTRLLIAAGAWTPEVFEQLFPTSRIDIPVSSLAGHSLVVKSPRWAQEHEASGCHAIFSTSQDGFSPEIFSRVGEEIYLAGLNDSTIPLPESPDKAPIDPQAIAALKRVAGRLLGKDGTDVSDLQMMREGLCFRPVTNKGVPILAKVKDEDLGGVETKHGPNGVYIAAGHGPWGISHSLGTGKVMQEMIEGVSLSANVDMLSL
ncbi:FAD dependent oxidoreductase [Polychaeton citri CBS 116435]|uniref:FAD dependent oxidoreductase n=1 Tax=Polychaeton citri CBS 116435 TaxID=1314669 RepID=A0A9P4UQU1_9PEZI|nr:FAD dependent oxidoreductase [Polychaeton citri CBS 116435]